MNKKTEKKIYVAPQMTVLKMDTNTPLLNASYYEKKMSTTGDTPQYQIVDFD